MTERPSPLAPDTSRSFIDAIVSDDLGALTGQVRLHGTEIVLDYRHVLEGEDGETDVTFTGTPLCLAAYLRREALSLFLVEQGARHRPAEHSEDNWAGWVSTEVLPIEQAVSFGMPELTRALMQSKPLIDWDYRAGHDRDDFGGERRKPCLFLSLINRPSLVEFIGHVGLFAGKVANREVSIAKGPEGFAISIDGHPLGCAATMAESLLAVRDLLGIRDDRMRIAGKSP